MVDSVATPPGHRSPAPSAVPLPGRVPLFTERWAGAFGVSTPAFWLSCFALAVLATGLVGIYEDAPRRYFALCWLLALAGFLMVPAAVHICRALLVRWARTMDGFIKGFSEAEAERWIDAELKFFDSSRQMVIASSLLGAVAVLAYTRGNFLQGLDALASFCAVALVFSSACMAGCGLGAMFGGTRAILKLGRSYRERIFVTSGKFGITSTGRVLAKCWLVIGVVWFVFTCTALLGPRYSTLSAFLFSYPVIVVAVPTLPVILGCFIGSQVALHDAMTEYKRREIVRIERMIHELTPDKVSGFTKDTQETIEFLRRRVSELESLPDWPFSTKALAGVGGSVITAVLPVLVEGILTAENLKKLVPFA